MIRAGPPQYPESYYVEASIFAVAISINHLFCANMNCGLRGTFCADQRIPETRKDSQKMRWQKTGRRSGVGEDACLSLRAIPREGQAKAADIRNLQQVTGSPPRASVLLGEGRHLSSDLGAQRSGLLLPAQVCAPPTLWNALCWRCNQQNSSDCSRNAPWRGKVQTGWGHVNRAACA